MSLKINYLLVSQVDTDRIASIDATTQSPKNEKKYVSTNSVGYFVLLNTWGFLIQSHTAEGWASLWLELCKQGTIPVIKGCQAASDNLIHGKFPLLDNSNGYLQPILQSSDDAAVVLQLLRYPKRFSPKNATAVQEKSLQDFLLINSEIKRINVSPFPSWLIMDVRQKIATMIGSESAFVEWQECYFSNGVAANARRPMGQKLLQLSYYHSNYDGMIQYPLDFSRRYCSHELWRGSAVQRNAVIAKAVPKSYKSARIIAEEPAENQFFLQGIASILYTRLRDNNFLSIVNVKDQSENQEMARKGSIDGSYATIDLSSASDRLSESLYRSIFPEWLISLIDPHRCAYIDSGKQNRIRQMFATSGSALTFPIESITFAAIALVATDYVALFSDKRKKFKAPHVFGDDIVVDDRVCETCICFLEALGFVVNKEKSFFGKQGIGFYRESCGVEYLDGLNMASKYFTRKTVDTTAQGVASLISLEKRLFGVWSCRLFLIEVVRSIKPSMTSHPMGCDCDDLWEPVPYFETVPAPGSIDKEYTREVHLALKSAVNSERNKPTDLLRLGTGSNNRLLSHWYYYQYLEKGPLYMDPLSELLRVSTSRCRYQKDTFEQDVNWKPLIE